MSLEQAREDSLKVTVKRNNSSARVCCACVRACVRVCVCWLWKYSDSNELVSVTETKESPAHSHSGKNDVNDTIDQTDACMR